MFTLMEVHDLILRLGIAIYQNLHNEGGVCFLIFARIYVDLWVGRLVCSRPTIQTKNDRELKFGTHTPLDHKNIF